MKFKSDIDIESLSNATTDTDRFIVSDGGILKYRTGSQVLSDLAVSSLYVPYTGATGNVDLGTHTLLAKDLIINHSSGSGIAASITKNGSGEALTVIKGSGSGNAMSVTGGLTSLIDLSLSTVANAAGDFLTHSGSTINKRTPAQVLSDISACKVVNLTVSTAAATLAKTTAESVTFEENTVYIIKFTLGNSVSSPTINGINIRLGTTNASTTTFSIGANTVVPMYYNATNNVMQITGSYRTDDATEDYNLRWENSVQAGVEITQRKIIMEGIDGKFYPLTIGNTTAATKTVSTQEFRLDGTILVYNTTATIAANAIFSNVYVSEYFTTTDYTFNQSSGFVAYRSTYLVGTVNSSGNFVLDNTTLTSWLTQTLPTTDDGKVYIYLGITNNTTTAFRLEVTHPIYQYKNGKLGLYSSIENPITGTGTTNFLSKFTGATSLGNSQIFDNGTNVGIGTTNPTQLLHLDSVAPKIRFRDTTRGVFWDVGIETTTNTFRFTNNTGGANGIYAFENGSVGIGTLTPSQKLHVIGSTRVDNGGLFLGGTSSISGNDPQIRRTNSSNDVSISTGGSDRVTILGTGNVGIGTTSPGTKLHIFGPNITTSSDTVAQSVLRLTRDITDPSFPDRKDSAVDFMLSRQQAVGNNLPYTRFDIRLSGTTDSSTPTLDVMSLLYNGNVGIGTTSPQAKLDVRNSLLVSHTPATVDFESSTSTFDISGNIVYFGTSVTSTWRQQLKNINPFSGESNLTFSESVNGGSFSDHIEINSYGLRALNGDITAVSGSVLCQGLAVGGSQVIGSGGLGSFSPGTAAAPSYSFSGDSNTGVYRPGTDIIGFSTAGTEKMRITSSGNVGIGTTTFTAPSYGDIPHLAVANISGATLQLRDSTSDTLIGDTLGRIQFVSSYINSPFASANIRTIAANNASGGASGGGHMLFETSIGSTGASPLERMRITSSGNVSIGNTNNTFKLDVSGTGRFTDNLNVTTESRYFQAAGPFAWGNSTTIGARMGTDGVAGLIDFRRWLGSGTLHHVAAVRQIQGGSSRFGLGFLADDISTNSVATTVRMYIDPNNGNVGIATTSPSEKLDVNGNLIVSGNFNNLYVGGKTNSNVDGIRMLCAGDDSFIDCRGGSGLNFRLDDTTGDTQRIKFHSGGNVSIGNTNNTFKLDVSGTVRVNGESLLITAGNQPESRLKLNNSSSASNRQFHLVAGINNVTQDGFSIYDSVADNTRFVVQNSGNISIGNINDTYKLDVTGTIRATGDVIAFSDERVKENIRTIENALDKVNKLRGVEYNKIGEEKKSIGVIAQEIEKILPQVVHEDEEGMKSVAYGNIVGVLIEAIKEQQKKIDELKMKIDGITN
jgi:hypothetical protein